MSEWLGREPHVVTAGAGLFAEALTARAVATPPGEWRPPMPGTEAALVRVTADPRRPAANARALDRMLAAGATLVDVRPAAEALGLAPGEFLHAGPPLDRDRMCGPMRGALTGALLFEGLADTPERAADRIGDVSLEPCHHRDAVGPMAGVVSPSMWLFQLRDETHDTTAWCSLNEGLGTVLRYGPRTSVIQRSRWITSGPYAP